MGGLTRRQFGRGAAAGAVLVGTAGLFGLASALGGSPAQAFAVEHGERVTVRIGNGKRFAVEVIERSTGDVLEHETELTVGSLFGLRSDHVRFYPVNAPGT